MSCVDGFLQDNNDMRGKIAQLIMPVALALCACGSRPTTTRLPPSPPPIENTSEKTIVETVEVTRIVTQVLVVTATPDITAAPTSTPAPTTTPIPETFIITYTVLATDTMKSLAQRFGVSETRLKESNKEISKNGLKLGQILTLELSGAQGKVKSDVDKLRVRSAPKEDKRNIITRIEPNAPLLILARTSDNIWFLVLTQNGTRGFVMTQYVDVLNGAS
jgi:LysM repeat protein